MSRGGRPSLPYRVAAALVRLVGRLVPRDRRDRWVEEWQGELWHELDEPDRRARGRRAREEMHVPSSGVSPGEEGRRRGVGLPIRGIVVDALAMRRAPRGVSGGAAPLVAATDVVVHAVRVLRASPGFTVVAVLVFAVGIGAGTAVFGLLDAVLWSPLDLPDAARLVQVQQRVVTGSGTRTQTHLSAEAFRAFAEDSRTLEGLAGLRDSGWDNIFYLTGTDEPERLEGALVTPGFFEVVGARARLGRVFTAGDAERGERIVVLAHGLWRRRFGADPDVVGSTIRLDGERFQVVGVLPASFELDAPAGALLPGDEVELWAPVHVASGEATGRWLATDFDQVLARVRSTSTLAAAEAELEALLPVRPGEPAARRRVRLVPVRERLVAPARSGLLLLAGIVGIVLLLVCLNVAGLQLARTAERGSELAVRAALGAGPARLARQLVTEGLLLALGGGIVALLATTWAIDLVVGLAPDSVPRLETVTISPRGYGFALALATASGLLATLLPAHAVSHSDPAARMRSGRTTSSDRGDRRLRDALVIGQIAAATLLLIGGGLLGRSFLALQRVDHSMRIEAVGTLDIWVPFEARDPGADEAVRGYFERVLEVAHGTPGVVEAALASSLPFRARDYYTPEWRRRIVSPGYFELLEIPVRRGRVFTGSDRPGSPEVVVINETLARQRFGDRDPVGRRLEEGPDGEDAGPVVVGVVGDTRHVSVDEPALPAAWVPHAQSPDMRMSLMVRTRGDPRVVLPALRTALWEIDPDQPLARPSTLESLLAESAPMQARRFNFQALAAFGGVAILLALTGIYAVLARSVAQRRREFGVRRAVGARGVDVCVLVLRQGVALAGIGAVLGGLGSLGLAGFLGSLLYEIEAADPLTYLAVGGLVVGTCLLATWLPARRALRVDPVTVLVRE